MPKRTCAQRRSFTPRQLKYKHNRLLGMSQYNAAISAGYSPKTATHACDVDRVVKSSMYEEFERAGLTGKVQAQQITEMALTASKIQNATLLVKSDETGKMVAVKSSDDFIEVPDYANRLSAHKLAAQLKGQLSDAPVVDQSQHLTFTIVTPQVEDGASTPVAVAL